MKKKLITVILSLALLLTFMPLTVFADTPPYYWIQIDGTIESLDYAINPEDPDDFSQYTNSKSSVNINIDILGRDLKIGDRICYRLNVKDGYRLEKTFYNVVVRSIATSCNYSADLIPAEPDYDLPDGLTIRDSDGSDIPADEGGNWEILEDAQSCDLHIYCDDAVISGYWKGDIKLHGTSAAIDSLTLEKYGEIELANDVDEEEREFRLTVLGKNSLYSIFSWRPQLIVDGSGAVDLLTLYADSYHSATGYADVLVCGEDTLSINIEDEIASIFIEGELYIENGTVNYRTDENKYPVEILSGIICLEDNELIPARLPGEIFWSNAKTLPSEDSSRNLTRYLAVKRNGELFYPVEFTLRHGIKQADIDSMNDEIAATRKADIDKTPIKLTTGTAAVKGSNKVKVTVSWNKVPNANCYYINGSKTTATSKSFTVSRGTTNKYSVCAAYSESIRTVKGTAKTVTVKPAPKNTVISSCKNIRGKKIRTKWTKTAGAKYYQVSVSPSRSKIKYAARKTTRLTFTKSKLRKGKTYYVKVRAVVANGRYGSWSKVKTVKVTK